MEKAYDIKELGNLIAAKAKEEGLEIAEEAIETLGKSAWEGTKDWVKQSAVLSENKVDDVIAPFVDTVDSAVEAAIEKLDLDGDGE